MSDLSLTAVVGVLADLPFVPGVEVLTLGVRKTYRPGRFGAACVSVHAADAASALALVGAWGLVHTGSVDTECVSPTRHEWEGVVPTASGVVAVEVIVFTARDALALVPGVRVDGVPVMVGGEA